MLQKGSGPMKPYKGFPPRPHFIYIRNGLIVFSDPLRITKQLNISLEQNS